MTMLFSYPFRIFLSYAHADADLVEKMAAILTEAGLQPLWDRDIRPGTPFTDAIKELIMRSHLFMPVLTENSHTRPWVHQETGYAHALNIPIVPIAIGNLPSEMIASLQAISIQPDLSDLNDHLYRLNLENLVAPEPPKPRAIVEIADFPETRAEAMIRYAQWVADLGSYGYARLSGISTVFAIPNCSLNDPIWKLREGENPRSEYFLNLQLQERLIMEQHARIAGCSLLIYPMLQYTINIPSKRRARAQVLRDFIASMSDDLLKIVVSPIAQDKNQVIIGDYFYAESVSPRPGGYLQTVFHSHPPTVLQKVRQYDQLFEGLYKTQGVSVDQAVTLLDQMITENRE